MGNRKAAATEGCRLRVGAGPNKPKVTASLGIKERTAIFRPAASCSDRKPVECRQGLQAGLNVPEIDLGLEKPNFLIQLAFVDVDVP